MTVLFWICAALLTAGVVLALTRPLLAEQSRDASSDAAQASDTAVYRDQLAEIETDCARGLISDMEAQAARVEIARRLIASVGPEGPAESVTISSGAKSSSQRLFLAVAGLVPALALVLYAALGSPGTPSVPVAERLAKQPGIGSDFNDLIARVEAQLRSNPSDGRGWDVIAPVYLRLERFRDAAFAYQRALDLIGETPTRLAGLAEATVLANDGVVTELARKSYVRLLELEPGRVEARFGLALAQEQDGEIASAEATYKSILADAPPNAPWREFVTERLEAIALKRGGEPKGKGQPPSADAGAAVAALPDGERRQLILQMVEGLAAKLKADGRDLDGWQRLLRAWTVLGDSTKAEAALAEARKALAGDGQGLAAINAFAKSIGLRS